MRTHSTTLFAIALAATALFCPAASQAAETLPAGPMSLLSLPASNEEMVFSGERAAHTLLVVAQPEQLTGAASLYLTLSSAVSVAPEWSNLVVTINDQPLGTLPLKSGEPYSVQIPVPAGVLQAGYNAVSFRVDQAHRVDCSIEATYELWTRVDPAASGIVFEGVRMAAPDFTSVLAAVRVQDGTSPIHGITGSLEGVGAKRLLAMVQTLAIGAAIDRPDVDFSADAGQGPGIDLLTGTRNDLIRGLGTLASEMPLTDGVNIGRRADGRIVVALVADTDEQFAQGLDGLKIGLASAVVGSTQGLAALATLKGVAFPQSGKLSFAQMGIDGRNFGGRRFDDVTHFQLPDDFYPADYGQAQINLDALYAWGLAPGAALQFRLNDQVVSTLKLSGSRVGEAKDRRLPIPLSAFRPGLNTLEVEATLPSQVDAGCSPGTTADNGRRLRLDGNSTLELPRLARVGRFPDLAAIENSVIGRGPAQLNVVTPTRDPSELRVAATTLARLAFSSGRVIAADLSSSATADENMPVLVVGAVGNLPQDLVQALPIDLNAEPLSDAGTPGSDTGANASLLGALPSIDSLTQNAQLTLDDVRSTFYGLGLTAGLHVDVLRGDEPAPIAPAASTDLLVAQTMNAAGLAPVTVVTAPSLAQLQQGLSGLVSADGWSRLGGSAVSFKASGEKLQTVGSRYVQYYPSTDTDFGNMRLIAAGWMSNKPSLYVLFVLTFAALLGLATHAALVRTRKRR